MDYIESISWQFSLFFKTCGFGFFLGALFEVFRMLRMVFNNGRHTVVWDILYMSVASVLTFLFLLVFSNGTLRLFTVTALISGWFVFYITLGKRVQKLTDGIIFSIKAFISKAFKALFMPLQKISDKIKRMFSKISGSCAKKFKKVTKKFNFHLKFTNGLLYNSKR